MFEFQKYFQPALENIKQNTNENFIGDEHINYVCRQILEEVIFIIGKIMTVNDHVHVDMRLGLCRSGVWSVFSVCMSILWIWNLGFVDMTLGLCKYGGGSMWI